MKQKLFSSIIAIALSALTASAQDEKALSVNAGSIENIVVASDMHVVLLSAPIKRNSFFYVA